EGGGGAVTTGAGVEGDGASTPPRRIRASSRDSSARSSSTLRSRRLERWAATKARMRARGMAPTTPRTTSPRRASRLTLADLARHGHEAHAEPAALLEPRAAPRDHHELLGLVAHGQDEAARVLELGLQGIGHAGGGRGHDDRVERRLLGPAQVAV